MKNNWTEAQQDAIQARGGTLLVSAAAGSGKTSVLVERVLQRLTDPEHPTPANHLLIVTFTKAATSEMRSRLSAGLDALLQQDPDNRSLQRQKMLLPSARICTIDAFCTTLVRENFDQLSVSPDFRILDESEAELLLAEAADQVIGTYYESENDSAFQSLADLLVTGRDDAKLVDYILRLYRYSRSWPSPNAWLHSAVAAYQPDRLEDSEIIRVVEQNALELCDFLDSRLQSVLPALRASQELSQSNPRLFLEQDAKRLKNTADAIRAHDYEKALHAAEYDNQRWSSPITKKTCEKYSQQAAVLAADAQAVHDLVKSTLTGKLPALLPATLEETREDCETLRPMAEKLVEAVEHLDQLYTSAKAERNALDFSDTELLALQLLAEDPAAENLVPTPFAHELSEQFDEILIDECQDINRAQDCLFRALSQDENNLFMVGDVKQSIYRFRQASPELFLERQNAYPLYDRNRNQYPAKIILGQNFRSRSGVLDAVNFLFRQLMSREAGDLDYTAEQELRYGSGNRFPKRDDPDVELHILGESESVNAADYTARLILREIERSADSGRPLSFRDFAVLLQSPKSSAELYKSAFSSYGIPCYTDASESFLQMADIQSVRSLLRIIDNPLQDVPLLSALFSPFFGFTADELAAIRSEHKKGNLYAAVLQSSKEGNRKCTEFLRLLRRFRTWAAAMPSGELLREIFEEIAYLSIVRAMPNGTQRAANLQLLLSMADQYDSTQSAGLAGFLRYLDRMEKSGTAPASASTLSPDANVVRIMSIHKSKGLQFPVCIVGETDHGFNDTDLRSGLILHPDLGIGLKGRDPETGNTYPTLFHTAVREETRRRSRAESLRVLYVAMTRAEEKLILVGQNRKSNLLKHIYQNGTQLSGDAPVHPYAVKSAGSFLDWLELGFLRHPYARALQDAYCDGKEKALKTKAEFTPSDVSDFEFRIGNTGEPIKVVVDEEPQLPEQDNRKDIVTYTPTEKDRESAQVLLSRMTYQYPFAALQNTVSKRTASKTGEEAFSPLNFAKRRPEFLSKGGLTPAERGTAQHKFMQYADFASAEQNPEAERDRLQQAGLLSPAEAKAIRLEPIRTFFTSDLYRRIRKSPNVLREKQFAVLLKAGYFNPELPGESANEPVLVQGAIDCAFEEDGNMVIVDYKTDRVKAAEELRALYTEQLHIYGEALQQITGKPVHSLLLWSFSLNREVPIE